MTDSGPDWLSEDGEYFVSLDNSQLETLYDEYGGRSAAETVRRALADQERLVKEEMRPEDLFRQFYQLLEDNGGTVPVTIVGEAFEPMSNSQTIRFGLDDDERMCIEESPRSELVASLREELEQMDSEELLEVFSEEAERDDLIRLLVAIRARADE